MTVLAAVLRVIGLSFGLPFLSNYYVRPDETLVIVPALGSGTGGASLVYPGLLPALCAVLFGAYFQAARVFGGIEVASPAAHFVLDPTPYVLIARGVSVAAGTVTTVVVFLLGRRLGPGGGLLAATLYATAPLPVRDAHFGVTDTLMTMLCAVAVHGLVRFHGASPGRDLAWLTHAALGLGLAVAAKYPAVALVPLATVVVLASAPGRGWRRAVLLASGQLAVVALVFVVVNPGTPGHASETRASLAWVLRAVAVQEGGWSPVESLARVAGPLRYGPGELPGLLAAALGLGLAWRRGGAARTQVAILAGALVVFLGPLLAARIVPFRYALPALPFVAVLAAHGIAEVWRAVLHCGRPPVLARTAAGALVLLCVLPPLARSVWLDLLLARDDSRTVAGRWIAAHVPAGATVVMLGGPECEPQVVESRASIARRIDFAMARYGSASGRIVSELYRLQLEWRGNPRLPAHEVYRMPAAIVAREAYLVAPSSPVPNPACTSAGPSGGTTVPGDAVTKARFEAIDPSLRGVTGDQFDAFFLPWSHLWRVRRPGPNIEILVGRLP